MFKFNAAVMGFGNNKWLMEVLHYRKNNEELIETKKNNEKLGKITKNNEN